MSLKSRLQIGISILTFLSLLLVSGFFINVYRTDRIDTTLEHLIYRAHSSAEKIQSSMATGLLPPASENFIQHPQILSINDDVHWTETLILNSSGELVFAPKSVSSDTIKEVLDLGLVSKLSKENLKEGTLQLRGWLLAYSFIPAAGFVVIVFTSPEKVFRLEYFFLIQFLSALILSWLLVWIYSSVFAKKITASFRMLIQSMTDYGQGKFSARAVTAEKGEVGQLAVQFNLMADQIQTLVEKEKIGARREQELKTAQRVQEYFLPLESLSSTKFDVTGFYKSASECGGDWYYYHQFGPYVYILLGDVTGHGTASAMLTSSCRSAISLILSGESFLTPSDILNKLNRTIYETVRGDLNMTMLAVRIDLSSGSALYSNASHEMPWLWNRSSKKVSRKDLILLSDIHGPRLGQQPNVNYSESTTVLVPNSRLFIFSDGVFDVENEKGSPWGERQVIQFLSKCQSQASLNSYKNLFAKNLFQFQDEKLLKDDVSFVLFDLKQDLPEVSA